MVAKEFSRRPSDYLRGLGAYEAFCVDELCAHSLMQLREKAQKDAEAEARGQKTVQHKAVSMDWLEQQQNKWGKARGK